MAEYPIWVTKEADRILNHMYKYGVIKTTAGKTHEDRRHLNKTIADNIDECLDKQEKGTYMPDSTFKSYDDMEDGLISLFEQNIYDIVLWSNKQGPHKNDSVYPAFSDPVLTPSGHGIMWTTDHKKLIYGETTQTISILGRKTHDRNDILFERITTYPSFLPESRKDKAITLIPDYDLMPHMKKTRHYQEALTKNDTKQLAWLESLVQQPDSRQTTKTQAKAPVKTVRKEAKMPELRMPNNEQDTYSL